jgi:ABC-type hemin transport system ATPase subunit
VSDRCLIEVDLHLEQTSLDAVHEKYVRHGHISALHIWPARRTLLAAGDGELSRGTVDQLYLAARLALIDLLFQDARPPLLMDDPFVTFDPQRRQAALHLCREIADTHQVLFFTCHDGYDGIATEVITL